MQGKGIISRKHWELFYLLFPGLAVIIAVTFFPAVYALWVSFHETSYTNIGAFVGLKNYIKFFTNSSSLKLVTNSLTYVIGTVVFAVPIGYLFAIVLKGGIRGQKIFRSVLLIPWIISQVVIALLWKWFLDGTYGPFIYILEKLGFSKINFFGKELAMATLIFTNVWRTYPFIMVMMLAAIQTVPSDLYESATIDGANPRQCFFSITLPYTMSTLLISVIMITLESFNMVTLINTLTGGGPLNRTYTLSLSVYRDAFQNWKIASASTTGVVILFFNVFFSLAYIALLRRDD